jgi:hypothetical protein
MTAPAIPLVNPPPPAVPEQLAEPMPLVAFPSNLRLALATTTELTDDMRIDRAVDGTGRARSFYLQPKEKIAAQLAGLTAQEWADFDTFYRAHRATMFTIPWGPCADPIELPVVFASPPQRKFHGNGYSDVTFALVEFP